MYIIYFLINFFLELQIIHLSTLSRHWLKNIVQPAQICEEDAMIVEKINNLEQYIQEQFTHHNELKIEYLAWTPQGITEDIIFYNCIGKI